MTHTDEMTITKEVEKPEEEWENEDEPEYTEMEIGTVRLRELSSSEEMKLMNRVTDSRGNPQPGEWYEQYFKKFVDEFEPSQEVFRELEYDKAPLNATKVQNSNHEDLKKVHREVMARVPNLNDVLGRSGTM